MDDTNPYAATLTAPMSRPAMQLATHPSLVRLAKLSWQLPVSGLGIAIFLSFVNDYVIGIWIFGLALLMLGTAMGFVLAVICLCLSARYRGLFGHALAGLLISGLLAFLTVTMLVGWRLVQQERDAARRRAAVQRNLDDLKRALERYESEQSQK